MMSVALLLAAGAVFFVFLQRDEPVLTATKVAERSPDPALNYGELQRVEPKETQTPDVNADNASPEPKPVGAKSEPQPASAVKPRSEPKQTTPQGWSVPSEDEIQEANGTRQYQLTAGAVMGLTIERMGIYDAPVFSSNSAAALDSGIVHEPETSLPWSKTPQRNVYLEGHRLGYAGTGSYLIFYNLDKLRNGDTVVLRKRDGTDYEYRVIASFVVDPSESWVTAEIRDRDLVTLQTCTNAPAYDKRLIVRAERV